MGSNPTGGSRQTALFSATQTQNVADLARLAIQQKPVHASAEAVLTNYWPKGVGSFVLTTCYGRCTYELLAWGVGSFELTTCYGRCTYELLA